VAKEATVFSASFEKNRRPDWTTIRIDPDRAANSFWSRCHLSGISLVFSARQPENECGKTSPGPEFDACCPQFDIGRGVPATFGQGPASTLHALEHLIMRAVVSFIA
jgi:hypothetical protein